MSAPAVACDLLDAAGVLLKGVQTSLGCRVHLERYPPDILGEGEFFCVYIHDDELGCFQGTGDTPSRALMKANSDRQTKAELLKRSTIPAASDAPPASSIPLGSAFEASAPGQREAGK